MSVTRQRTNSSFSSLTWPWRHIISVQSKQQTILPTRKTNLENDRWNTNKKSCNWPWADSEMSRAHSQSLTVTSLSYAFCALVEGSGQDSLLYQTTSNVWWWKAHTQKRKHVVLQNQTTHQKQKSFRSSTYCQVVAVLHSVCNNKNIVRETQPKQKRKTVY